MKTRAEINDKDIARILADFGLATVEVGTDKAIRNVEILYGVDMGFQIAETWLALYDLQRKLERLGDMVNPLA